jgi:hypothetical protein
MPVQLKKYISCHLTSGILKLCCYSLSLSGGKPNSNMENEEKTDCVQASLTPNEIHNYCEIRTSEQWRRFWSLIHTLKSKLSVSWDVFISLETSARLIRLIALTPSNQLHTTDKLRVSQLANKFPAFYWTRISLDSILSYINLVKPLRSCSRQTLILLDVNEEAGLGKKNYPCNRPVKSHRVGKR